MGGFATHKPIPTEGLEILLDIGNTRAYPGSGTAIKDISGNGYTATMSNGAGYNSNNLGTILFDGVDDKCTIPNDVSFNDFGTRMSISIWLSPRYTPNQYVGLIAKDDTTVGTGFGFFTLGGNIDNSQIRWGFYDYTAGANEEINFADGTLNNFNVWAHIVATWGNGELKLYKNGRLMNSKTGITATPTTNTYDLSVMGRNQSPTIREGAGLVGHVAIYKSILDQNGVSALYEAFKDRFS